MMCFDNRFSLVSGWAQFCTQCSTQTLTTFDKESSLFIKPFKSHRSQKSLTQAPKHNMYVCSTVLLIHRLICFVCQGQACAFHQSLSNWAVTKHQLAGFSVTACISVSLQDGIIRVSSQVAIVFWTLLHYLSHILMLILQPPEGMACLSHYGRSILALLGLCFFLHRRISLAWMKLVYSQTIVAF